MDSLSQKSGKPPQSRRQRLVVFVAQSIPALHLQEETRGRGFPSDLEEMPPDITMYIHSESLLPKSVILIV